MYTITEKQVELYIEKIRSGIEVTGTIDNDYIEIRYKYMLNSTNDLKGYFHITGLTKTITRSYATIQENCFEFDNGKWRKKGRKNLSDDMYVLIGIAENFLLENGYDIL